MRRDWRDLALEDSALDYVLAQERIRSLEGDVVRYREVVFAALDALHDLTRRRDALQAQYDELLDQHRRCRELWLVRDGVAA